jgi:hypothetical protein
MSKARPQQSKMRLKKSIVRGGHGVHHSIRSNKRGAAGNAIASASAKLAWWP